jgi:hypothetical protein
MSTLGRTHPAATSADALAAPGRKGGISDNRSDNCPAGTCPIQNALAHINQSFVFAEFQPDHVA